MPKRSEFNTSNPNVNGIKDLGEYKKFLDRKIEQKANVFYNGQWHNPADIKRELNLN